MNEDKTMLSIYLAGFLDGRGGFFIHKDKRGSQQFIVKVASNDNATLNLFDRILTHLNIKHMRTKKEVGITSREDVKQFIGFILPFIQIKEDEIIDFRNRLFEYELSFIKKKS